MSLFKKYCRVQIVAADMPTVISKLSQSGMVFENIEAVDILTINASIKKTDYKQFQKLLLKAGATCKLIGRDGGLWNVDKVWMRPILFVGLILYFAAAAVISNRIFFIEVVGNQKVSQQCILANAEEIGMKFGMLSSDVRSEEWKNQLLENIPQLQWVGITVRGCVAQIHVSERSAVESKGSEETVVTHIVSAYDGVITDQTVFAGSSLFHVGDAVSAGDILVSGYVDCGIKFLACHAKADVFALTKRERQFISPSPQAQRDAIERYQTCYKFRIGKKVINLCNHSGIMDTRCVKMYSEDYWSLPGGFRLPVSIIKIAHADSKIFEPVLDEDIPQWLAEFARQYLKSEMVSGEILSEELHLDSNPQVNVLTGIYACHEMIGREKYEGIME